MERSLGALKSEYQIGPKFVIRMRGRRPIPYAVSRLGTTFGTRTGYKGALSLRTGAGLEVPISNAATLRFEITLFRELVEFPVREPL